MVQYDNLLHFQIMIFLLMAVGYFLRKWSIITASRRRGLTDLIITVILPCNIVNAFLIEMNMEILKAGLLILVISTVIQISYKGFSAIFYRKVPDRQKAVLKYATLCPNSGFLGNPLVEGLYGAQGLFYASIFLIPQRIVIWTGGIACFTTMKGKEAVKKVVTHPCIIAAEVGLLIMLLQIPIPTAIGKTIASVSSCTTALVMFVIGGILAEIDIKTVFNGLAAYYSLLRLIVLPGIVLAACWFLRIDPLVSAVSVVLTGMPAGTTTAILAEQYGADSKFGVKCVFLSTALSLVTIPLLCVVIEQVFLLIS